MMRFSSGMVAVLRADTCGIDSLLVTYFLNRQNRKDLHRRDVVSKGVIS
jgi:hypothetical protein